MDSKFKIPVTDGLQQRSDHEIKAIETSNKQWCIIKMNNNVLVHSMNRFMVELSFLYYIELVNFICMAGLETLFV